METSGIGPALILLIVAAIGVERAIEIIWNYIEWALLSFVGWQPEQLKAPHYGQFKSGSSMVLGVIIGIVLANFMALQLFAFLGPTVPGLLDNVSATWDLLVTGFLIGALSKPVHDLLGVLTQIKNFLSASAIRQRESAAAALADGVLKLAQSEAQAMVDVPGVGPSRLPMGGSARGSGMDEESDVIDEIATTDRYINTLHNRTVQ